MSVLLVLCGVVAAIVGAQRGYALAREALAPLVHEGDPTRSAIEATRPFPARPRVRRFASRVAGSIAWLVVAMYGLFLIARALELSAG